MHFSTSTLLVLLSTLPSIHAILTQAQADARCSVRNPGWVAIKKPDGTGYSTCAPPPENQEMCFEQEYTDPKTGKLGCCPDDSPYSYDFVSLEGKCCPTGQTFSWDASVQKGGCCSAGNSMKCSCSCQADEIPFIYCPDADGKIWTTKTGRAFYNQCGKHLGGVELKVEPGAHLIDCVNKCAAYPGCHSVDYFAQNCYHRTASRTAVAPRADINSASEIIPMTATDTCPTLSEDVKSQGSLVWKFSCGKYPQAGSLLRTGYKTTTLQQCVQDCASDPRCNSVYWGFKGGRAGECDLVTGTGVTMTGIDVDFVGVMSVPRRI